MKTFAAAVALVALLALSSAPVQAQTNFTNLLSAIQGRNLTGLATLVRLAGLESTLSNPNLTATLFAPSNAAVAEATAALTAARVNTTLVVPIILQYHLVPNATINFTNGLILPTVLSPNVTNTTRTLTVLSLGNGSWYLGSIIPGAEFNISSRISAGRSQMFVIDGVLVPPSALFNVSLTIRDWARVTPGYSILSRLINNDTLISNVTGNPNLAVTLFAPNDTAMNTLFNSSNVTLAQISGTPTAQRLLLNHIIPDFPYMALDVPVGNTTVPTAAATVLRNNDTISVARTAGANGTVSVRGQGNSAPIRVLRADIPAGMSVVHQVASVIIYRQNTTTTTPRK